MNARGARDCREHGVEIFVTVSVADDPGFAAGAVSLRLDECALEEPAGRARHIVVQSYVFRRNTVHTQEVAQIVRLRLRAFAEKVKLVRLEPRVICDAKIVVCSRIYRTQARSGAAGFINKPRRHEVAQAERVGIAAHLELEDLGIAPYVARTEYPIVLGRGQRVESEGRRRDESSGFRFAGRFPGVRLRPRPQSLGDTRHAEAKRCTEAGAEAYPKILFGALLSRPFARL